MAAQDPSHFFQSGLHKGIRQQRTWRPEDDIRLMDLIRTSLQKPEELDEHATHSLEFLRTIREIFSHKTHDVILKNLQYFRALADENGTITDAFLAERPMGDWVQMLVEQILHDIAKKQKTGSLGMEN
ncbi:MAG: hypothetical protein M1815_001080 [Lichina confinis]|nr:MAG: hypothetical protein M1815_001080 [Lichina confinis]